MENFMNDFEIFFTKIFSALTSLWNWLTGTIVGEILLFIIIISLFLFLINLIVNFKD